MTSTSAVDLDVGTGDRPLRRLVDRNHSSLVGVLLDDQRFDVEHHVCGVFEQSWGGGKLVLSTANFDLRDRTAFQAGQENATKAIPDRRSKTTLERFGDEQPVGCRQTTVIALHATGQL